MNHMRVRSADRADWQRILARRFIVKRVDSPDYRGYVTLLRIDEVSEPLYVTFDAKRVCIVDRGYTWMQHFPDGARYVLLSAFDEQGELVQWYIDVIGRMGLDEQGVPWWEDLYLDIVVSPEGKTLLLDVDELDEALRRGVVTQSEYDSAWREASTLLSALEEDLFPLLWLSDAHHDMLKAELRLARG